jgi:hypothetical protein
MSELVCRERFSVNSPILPTDITKLTLASGATALGSVMNTSSALNCQTVHGAAHDYQTDPVH